MATELAISDIRTDGGTQPRAQVDGVTVSEYAEAMQRGGDFPPVRVMYDGQDHWLYDGFHRLRAARKAGRESVTAKVEQGTQTEAQWASLAANKRHGLRRSQEDKRRAIKRALKGWGEKKSNNQIAQHIGCSDPTVAKYRRELESTSKIKKSTEREGADGRTINTSNIGGSTKNENGVSDTETGTDTKTTPTLGGDGAPTESVNEETKTTREHNISVIGSSESNEYYTPQEYLRAARNVMGDIDLDPASCAAANGRVQAGQFYSKQDDGLREDWHGRVWLNPPYGRKTGDFIEKLMQEYRAGRVDEAVVLVNAHSAETNWFEPLWNGLICFTDHRIDFHTQEDKGGSTHGSAFSYFGPHTDRFIEEFDRFGYVVRRVRPDA